MFTVGFVFDRVLDSFAGPRVVRWWKRSTIEIWLVLSWRSIAIQSLTIFSNPPGVEDCAHRFPAVQFWLGCQIKLGRARLCNRSHNLSLERSWFCSEIQQLAWGLGGRILNCYKSRAQSEIQQSSLHLEGTYTVASKPFSNTCNHSIEDLFIHEEESTQVSLRHWEEPIHMACVICNRRGLQVQDASFRTK